MAPARLGIILAAALVLGPVPSSAAPANRALTWLTKALTGPRRPFEGRQRTIVSTKTGSVETEVRVSADGKGAMRRSFEKGSGKGLVLLQTANATYQKSPGGAFHILPAVKSGDPAATARQIVTNYRVSVIGEVRAIGRKATQVKVAARYPYNPSRLLWVDNVTGLVLRDELFAPDGRRRSLTEFLSVTFAQQRASDFTPPKGASPATGMVGPGSFASMPSARAVEVETGRSVPIPSHLPPGYRVTTYGVMTTGGGFKTPAVRYSDGLASFTVFVRGARPGGAGVGGPRGRGRGAGPHRFGRRAGVDAVGATTSQESVQQSIVTYTSRSAAYIAIGDIAAAELVRVVKSLP